MSSILPSAFSFAVHPKDAKVQKLPVDDSIRQKLKRRLEDLNHTTQTRTLPSNHHHHSHNNHRIIKNRIAFIKQKKHKNNYDANQIKGSKLSLHKLIETLDEKSLKNLIGNLIDKRPELAEEITELSPDVTVDMTLTKLNENIERILENLPYKVDPCSDYSYLRVKEHVNEFYSNLSDYILNFLPPVQMDLTLVISFLLKFLSKIYSKMPTFNTIEFNYLHSVTIEKLNSIFMNSLNNFFSEKIQNITIAISNNWLSTVKDINKMLDNKFIDIEDLLVMEINGYNSFGGTPLNSNEYQTPSSSGNNFSYSSPSSSSLGLRGLQNILDSSTEAANVSDWL